MNRSTPSLQKAKLWLVKAAAAAAASAEPQLPSIRNCARFAGVSLVTMQAAARQLHDEKVLVVKPGSGMRARLSSDSEEQPGLVEPGAVVGAKRNWRHVEAALARRIADSRYDTGTALPSFKKICMEFGVGYNSTKKALESLADAGALVRSGRKYRVPTLDSPRQGSSIVLIVSGFDPHSVGIDASNDSRVNQILRAVEAECVSAGLRLHTVVFNLKDFVFYLRDVRIELNAAFIGQRQVLGVIYWPVGTDEHCLAECKQAHVAGCSNGDSLRTAVQRT